MKKSWLRILSILATLLVSLGLHPVQAREPLDWAQIQARLENAQTSKGQAEIAKEVGLDWCESHQSDLGLVSQGLVYLSGASETSRLAGFNNLMGHLGSILIVARLASDVSAGKSAPAVLGKLSESLVSLAAGMKGGPIAAAFYAAQLFKTVGKAWADQAFGDPRWWPVYLRYFQNGPGRLSPRGWVALFGNGQSLEAYNQHMDSFFAEESGGVFYKEQPEARKLPSVTSNAATEQAEAYRIRFYREQLSKNLAGWAHEEAQRRQAEALEKLRTEIARMAQEGLVRIQVVDAKDQRALRSAWVEARYESGKGPDQKYGRTDESGTLELKGIPPWAKGILSVTQEGYPDHSEDLAPLLSSVDRPQTAILRLSPNQASLKVTVVDSASGSPVPDATIQGVHQTGRGSDTRTTNAQGMATLAFPRTGEFSLEVKARGYQDFKTSLSVGDSAREETLSLVPLDVEVSVSVLVRDKATGAPVPGASLSAILGAGSGTGTTDARGRVVLALKGAGVVALTASKPGYRPGTATATPEKGKATSTLELEPDTAALTVTVLDESTRLPLAGASVSLSGSPAAQTSGPDGKARLAIPSSGRVEFRVAMTGYRSRLESREVDAATLASVVALEPDRATLSVRVGDKVTGRPLEGVRVKATVGEASAEGYTDAGGTLSLAIPGGESVTVRLYKAGYQTAQVTKPIQEGRASASGTLQPSAQARIQLKLRNKSTGEPISGATVRAGEVGRTTGADGSAMLEVAPGESVRLQAVAGGYQTRSASGTAPPPGETRFIGWDMEPLGAATTYSASWSRTEDGMRFSGTLSIHLDPGQGTFKVRLNGRGVGEMTGPVDLVSYDDEGKETDRERVQALKRFEMSLSTVASSGTYDAGSGTLNGTTRLKMANTRSTFEYEGVTGKGDTIPTSFTNQVVRGRILDGNGSGYLADSETDPDRMRWELVDGTLTVLSN